MLSFAGPYFVIAAILALGGLMKIVRPIDTSNALEAVKLPANTGLVRVMGMLEMTVGATAIATGSRNAAILVAAAYLAFTGFVVYAKSEGTPIQSCGCFGRAETPPSLAHIVINLFSAAIAGLIAWQPLSPVTEILADQPGLGIPLVMLVAVGVYLVYVALTALPVALRAPQSA